MEKNTELKVERKVRREPLFLSESSADKKSLPINAVETGFDSGHSTPLMAPMHEFPRQTPVNTPVSRNAVYKKRPVQKAALVERPTVVSQSPLVRMASSPSLLENYGDLVILFQKFKNHEADLLKKIESLKFELESSKSDTTNLLSQVQLMENDRKASDSRAASLLQVLENVSAR